MVPPNTTIRSLCRGPKSRTQLSDRLFASVSPRINDVNKATDHKAKARDLKANQGQGLTSLPRMWNMLELRHVRFGCSGQWWLFFLSAVYTISLICLHEEILGRHDIVYGHTHRLDAVFVVDSWTVILILRQVLWKSRYNTAASSTC